MKKCNNNIVIGIAFVVVMSIISLINWPGCKALISYLSQPRTESVQQANDTLVQIHKDRFRGKNELTNIKGFTDRLLHRQVLGNLEYLKDENNVMHMRVDDNLDNPQRLVEEMDQLYSTCSEKNVPFMYVQIPGKEIDGYTSFDGGYVDGRAGETMNYWTKTFADSGIDVIDYRKEIGQSIAPEDVYFKTDAHMTTKAEWQLMHCLVDHMEDTYGIVFENKEQVMDTTNYERITEDFVGNFAKLGGKYFVGVDQFEMLLPKFDTKLTYYDETDSAVKAGDFQTAVMNGYEADPLADENTYWVTNYGHFTKPNYRFENELESDGPDLLIIMDSHGYRTISYMSLMCKSVTVVDPRFDGGTRLTQLLQSKDYDAVMVIQTVNLNQEDIVFNIMRHPNAEVVNHTAPAVVSRDHSYVIDITVKNTGPEVWSERERVRLCIWQDGVDWGYRVYLPDGVEVKPGETYTFRLENFVAPPEESTYLEFQMLQEGIQYFGEKKRVDIKAA